MVWARISALGKTDIIENGTLTAVRYVNEILDVHIWTTLAVDCINDLEHALHKEWAHTPLRVIRRLINSMRRIYFAVIQARGGHTRY